MVPLPEDGDEVIDWTLGGGNLMAFRDTTPAPQAADCRSVDTSSGIGTALSISVLFIEAIRSRIG